ncbi:pseudouridine synthase [Thiomicrorhabdus sp. ZW0627]|uniref:23S rRNA pseudouridine(2605) synthase RluB n=1 Tax=Thiomicrorhabdus sp. ZW0627 TaxID=3039774 RepID=UPI002436F3C5|nr:pseudouridine synthase [Thiomicrorhabdus sp. ZW0627]MDG6772944.1 pseudouridine synthase [Thiomicrorhabdus sp. ZW0627]
MNQQTDEKLQKILARAGYGSRRAVEALIAQGKVKLNGRVAQLGDRATETDRIQVNNQPVKSSRLVKQPTQVILYNKPEGRLCTRSDEKGRETIFTQLPRIHNGRWISIGRLDLNTSGLLILTNNGELANRLAHPSFEVEREYLVRIFGEVEDSVVNQLKKGIVLEDGPAKFEQISRFKTDEESMNNWFRVTIKEGRNREVRRMWESQGVQVSRLQRVRYGEFRLPRNLRKGKTQALTWKQINQLLKSVDLPEEARPDMRQTNNVDKKRFVKNSRSGQRALSGKKRTIHDLSKF